MRTGQPTCESTGPAAASTRTWPLVLPPWEARLCLAGEGDLGTFKLLALRVEAWEVGFLRTQEGAHVRAGRKRLQAQAAAFSLRGALSHAEV